ncbi:hypothetical protein [Ruminococcus albus]|uniref:DUF3592 domain-containing protein n=1 Tax=Ruminococcus albus TaxID=1264 RepID=A0A1H7ITH6_RUMAL|nr:hypothetical protein [Ruminococcus albus]SEK65222.1 hypothetical protein SAMN05216469_10472 [Ruminococcus albus]
MNKQSKKSYSYLLHALIAAVFCLGILYYHTSHPIVAKVKTYEDFKVNSWTKRENTGKNGWHTYYYISIDSKSYDDFEPVFTPGDEDIYTSYEKQKAEATKTKMLFKGSVNEMIYGKFANYSKSKLTLYKTNDEEVFPVYLPDCDAKEAQREYRQMHPTYLWLIAIIYLGADFLLNVIFGLSALCKEIKMRNI